LLTLFTYSAIIRHFHAAITFLIHFSYFMPLLLFSHYCADYYFIIIDAIILPTAISPPHHISCHDMLAIAIIFAHFSCAMILSFRLRHSIIYHLFSFAA